MKTFAVAVALALAALVGTLALEQEPTPLAADVDPRAFSGVRAQSFREELLAGGVPHPVGSSDNDRVRARLIALLERSGYAPRIEEGWACGAYAACARVRNVLATLPGTHELEEPVIVLAHYDSVGAGPGASDDGAGVAATLEIARALRAGPALRRDVRFVITDGEEAGLLGATAYAAAHGTAASAVVNMEARGTSGLALLFETGPRSAAVVDVVASVVARPKTSSLFSNVYELLPNDTDFTVFRRAGTSGANLAFIEGPSRYHTSLDDLAHASVGSLQHQGETGLALVRGFTNADLGKASSDRAVWFDLASRAIVRWPARWNTPAAIAALLLVAGAMARARARWSGRALAWSSAAAVGALVGSVLSSVALGALLYATGRAPSPWIAHPWPAFGAAAAFAGAPTLGLCGRLRDRWASFGAAWIAWGAVALASSFVLPGAAYLTLPPLAVAGVAALFGARVAEGRGWMVVPFAVGAATWASLFLSLPAALGMLAVPIYGLLASFFVLPLVPLLPEEPLVRRAIVLALLGCGVALTAAAFAVPVFSEDSPQRLNVLFVQDDRDGARWLLDTSWRGFRSGHPPDSMLASASFDREPVAALPLRPDRVYAAAAPAQGLPAPEATLLSRNDRGGARSVRVQLRSPRGATDLVLAFAPGVPLGAVHVAGIRMPPPNSRLLHYVYGDWQPVAVLGVPPEGVEVDVELGNDPAAAVLLDRTDGLPPEGDVIERARPPWSRPSQDGDGTIVSRHVEL